MYSKNLILYTLCVCLSCKGGISYPAITNDINLKTAGNPVNDINPYGSILEIPLPRGFTRIKKNNGSFAGWLRKIKLKESKIVYKFDGNPKTNQAAQFAVLDMSVGDKDLQQCADAVMRLRAEYLFSIKEYGAIHFADNAGKTYQFHEPYTSKNLHRYLKQVFAMCGSASLSKQLNSIPFKNIEPGDVLIRGGFPGHAVIVMDVAVNPHGLKLYLLAQSYMPAQDIHVLINPVSLILSPWYAVDDNELIQTPEYIFSKRELKRW